MMKTLCCLLACSLLCSSAALANDWDRLFERVDGGFNTQNLLISTGDGTTLSVRQYGLNSGVNAPLLNLSEHSSLSLMAAWLLSLGKAGENGFGEPGLSASIGLPIHLAFRYGTDAQWKPESGFGFGLGLGITPQFNKAGELLIFSAPPTYLAEISFASRKFLRGTIKLRYAGTLLTTDVTRSGSDEKLLYNHNNIQLVASRSF